MRKLFIICLIYLFFTTSLFVEVVNKINISGNNRVNEETIKIYGGIKIKEDYSEQDLNRILNDLYSTNFFKDVQVELSNNVLNINLINNKELVATNVDSSIDSTINKSKNLNLDGKVKFVKNKR